MTIYRYPDGIWLNSLLLAYIIAVIVLGLVIGTVAGAVFAGSIIYGLGLSLLAGVLLTHALVLAAYFAHECMHNCIFKQTSMNDRLGSVLCFMLGAGYYPYQRLKEKHFRHHVERQDVLSLNLAQHFNAHPKVKAFICLTEKWHIPSAEIYSHGLAMAAPFFVEQLKKYRYRTVVVLLTYVATFIAISRFSLALSIIVFLALITCYCVLGFMDMFQHDYAVKLSLDEEKQKPLHSRDYEQTHTFSNLLSRRFEWLNLLVLNFCYHNVHHKKSGEPWHRLPALHKKYYAGQCEQEVLLKEQWYRFHTHRIRRVDASIDEHSYDSSYPGKAHSASYSSKEIGASGVSFLVGV